MKSSPTVELRQAALYLVRYADHVMNSPQNFSTSLGTNKNQDPRMQLRRWTNMALMSEDGSHWLQSAAEMVKRHGIVSNSDRWPRKWDTDDQAFAEFWRQWKDCLAEE